MYFAVVFCCLSLRTIGYLVKFGNCVCVKITILLFTVDQSRSTLLGTVSFRRNIAGYYNYVQNSIMAECRDSDSAPVDTTEAIIGAINQVLGAENSDDSQLVSLKMRSLESASNGGSETPLPLGGDNTQKTKTRKQKKQKNKKAPSSQVATNSGGLQGSPSPSARLATQDSSQGTPILPSTPRRDQERSDPGL